MPTEFELAKNLDVSISTSIDNTEQTLNELASRGGPVLLSGNISQVFIQVKEANLDTGSNPEPSSLMQEFVLPEGYLVDISKGSWVASGQNYELHLQDTPGYLTFNPSTGQLFHTLTGPIVNDGSGLDGSILSYPQVAFKNGEGEQVNLNVNVEVIDDAPSVSIGGYESPEIYSWDNYYGTWDVDFGADGAAAGDSLFITVTHPGHPAFKAPVTLGESVDIIIDGKNYGSILFDSNGKDFAFFPDQDGDYIQGILNFTLTAKDSDGDIGKSETLSLFLSDPETNLGISHIGGDQSFNEANLPEGSSPNAGALTKEIPLNSSLTINFTKSGWVQDGDTYVLQTPQKFDAEGNLINGFGKLVYDTISKKLFYTLERNAYHGDEDSCYDVFPDLVVSGRYLRDGKVDVVIKIHDDSPNITLEQPTDPVKSGTSIEGDWTHSFGADGAADDGAYAVIVKDAYGCYQKIPVELGQAADLIVNGVNYGKITFKDSTYIFEAAPDTNDTISITVELTDKEGDTVSNGDNPIKITVSKPQGPDKFGSSEDDWFSESNLPDGSDYDPAALTKEIKIPADYDIDLTGWTPQGGGYKLQGPYGYLFYDDTNKKLTYTLEKSADHPIPGKAGAEDTIDINMSIVLKDEHGNTWTVSSDISIRDDAPEVDFTGDPEAVSGYEYVGDWGVHYGADGAAAQDALKLSVSVGGKSENFDMAIDVPKAIIVDGVNYGTLTLLSTGKFSFTPVANLEASLGFKLFAQDGDGDTSTSNGDTEFTITIVPPGHNEYYIESDIYDEANLATGSAPDVMATAREIMLPEGFSINLSAPGWTETEPGIYYRAVTDDFYGQLGQMIFIEATGQFGFILEKAVWHPQDNDLQQFLIPAVEAKDPGGNNVKLNIAVTVKDDSPTVIMEVPEWEISNDNSVVQGVFYATTGADQGIFETDTDLYLQFKAAYGDNMAIEDIIKLPKDGTPVWFSTYAGTMGLCYDAPSGLVIYMYEARAGLKGYTETLTIGMQDGEGDQAFANLVMNYKETVIDDKYAMNVEESALPGLGSSQFTSDSHMSTVSLPPTLVLEDTTEIIWTGPADPNQFKADGDLNGEYDIVSWVQVGQNLHGYADGKLVIEVIPEFQNGVFTGNVSSVLHRPFQHPLINVEDDYLKLSFGFTQKTDSGESVEGQVKVSIKDDMPFGSGQPDVHKMEVMEGSPRNDDVYLVVDASRSIDNDEMLSQVKALRALAETYLQNGIGGRFTLVTFGSKASLKYDNLTAEELLEALPADERGVQALFQGHRDGTNYNGALDLVQKEIDASFSDPDVRFMNKVVYFLSDGEPTVGNSSDESVIRYQQTWGDYLESNKDWLEVWAIGVDMPFSGGNHLWHVAGNDSDHIRYAVDFDGLADILVDTIQPTLGNILEGVSSADKTSVVQVQFGDAVPVDLVDNGDPSGMKNTGDIVLDHDGKKITIRIFENGEYRLMSDNIDDDYMTSLVIKVQDADGDFYTSKPIEFVVKDYVPMAYDKLAEFVGDENNAHFAGNILTDPSPQGDKDSLMDDARLVSIQYGNSTYDFNSNFEISIQTATGVLTINQFGEYTFTPINGNYSSVNESFTYKLRDIDGDEDTAVLTVKWEPAKAYDNIAHEAQLDNGEMGFAGNVMHDPSIEGEVDFVHSITTLANVEYNGIVKSFSSTQQVLNFDTEQGRLTIDWKGNYQFEPKNDISTGDVAQKFTYTLNESDGTPATLYVQKTGPFAQDNLAQVNTGFYSDHALGTFSDGKGWSQLCGNAQFQRKLDSDFLKPNPHPVIDPYHDDNYMRLDSTTTINGATKNVIFGTQNVADFINELGFTQPVYNPAAPEGAFVSTTFTSKGGEVVFDWSFGGYYGKGDVASGAIWILQDSSGRVISSGKLAENSGTNYVFNAGNASVTVPTTGSDQEYKLILGEINLGSAKNSEPSNLYVGSVVLQEEAYHFSGNILSDPSPDNAIDFVDAAAKLISVEHGGQVYKFNGAEQIEIETENGGTLIVHDDGSYFYRDALGGDGTRAAEDFIYTVQNSDGKTDDALLAIRGERFVVEGTGLDDVIDRGQYTSQDIIHAGNGNDIVHTGTGNSIVYGGSGNDVIFSNHGHDRIYGGSGNDELHGGGGNDTIYGGSGNDAIFGDAGNDLLYGGSGNNTLYGGTGADTFAWRHVTDLQGKDMILDFVADEGDKLGFSQLLDNQQNLDSYLTKHVEDISLNVNSHVLNFTISEGLFNKEVEIQFNTADSSYVRAATDYLAAGNEAQAHDILMNFLHSISC